MHSVPRHLPVRRRLAGILLIAISVFLLGSGPVYAQSTTASLSGRVFDAGHALLPDAAVVLTNRETATSRKTTSDSTGTFRVTALPPGVYDLRLARAGFSALQLEITLVMGEDRPVDLTMTIGPVDTTVTVGAGESLVDPSVTVLGRRITAREIEDLPIQGRLFLNLALLTPGILNSYNTTASGSGFAAAGQTGRNNTLLIDGLALDDLNSATPRSGLPLDAVSEFVVASNAPSAEYGQASGAIVNVLTKSGSNRFTGASSAYRRDGRWNARPGAAVLAVPSLPKPDLGQNIVAGSLGGPIRRNHSFFFASVERAVRESAFIVTSPQAPLLAPDEPASFPQKTQSLQVFGRGDAKATSSQHLTVRYRLSDDPTIGRMGDQDRANGTRQRAHDSTRNDDDLALIHTITMGAATLNELRVQRAGRLIEFDPTGYCSGCPSLEYLT